MTIELVPIPLPPSADASKLANFGREVKGVKLADITPGSELFKEIESALYTYDVLLFRDVKVSPAHQYALTKAFDPQCENYGHGNNKTSETKNSILHYLKPIPSFPQVQLIGNGIVYNHEGLSEARLKHPSHTTFHKTRVSPEDEANGITRFCRWHIDAALYKLNPPRVTTLYAINVPRGPKQICRYDDETGDELEVPLGGTAFVSGKTMFDILPLELKSLAVRSKVRYVPHPYVWMAPARAMSTGLGIETEGLEVPLNELPPWEESNVKVFPMTWKNSVTGNLHFEVHPFAVQEIIVDPLPDGVEREGSLYPTGGHIKDLKEVRELLYKMQRPGIAPSLVYSHNWHENDLVIFHNRGVLHTVVGALKPDEVRIFHQCNVAASDEPIGPTPEDVEKYQFNWKLTVN